MHCSCCMNPNSFDIFVILISVMNSINSVRIVKGCNLTSIQRFVLNLKKKINDSVITFQLISITQMNSSAKSYKHHESKKSKTGSYHGWWTDYWTEDLHKVMTTVTSHRTHLIILDFNVFVTLISLRHKKNSQWMNTILLHQTNTDTKSPS